MKKIIGLFLLCIILQANSFAGNYTWTGSTNSNWYNSGNWSPSGLPGSADTININTTTNSLVLDSNKTVRRLVINSGVLDLGGDTLTVSISTGMNGGQINNGVYKPFCTSLVSFAGTTFGAEVLAKGQIKLNGSVFNSTAYFEHSGSAAGTGAGGNTFNGTTTLKNSGTSNFRLTGTTSDTFNGDVVIINSSTFPSSGTLHLSYGAIAYFNGNVQVNSTSLYGVSFSPTGAGSSILGSGKTITVGSSGVFGTLVLRNFTQLGNTSQSITLNGTCNMVSSTFNGSLTLNTSVLLLTTSNFKEVSTFSKTGNGSDFSQGGNHFFKSVTINNNATNGGILRMAIADGDIFDENVTLNTNTGYIQMAYSDTSDFKGNVTINNSKVTFNTGSGCVKFTGTNSQVISGSSDYLISKLLVNKTSGNVTFQNSVIVDTLLNLHAGVLVFDATKSITLKAITQVTEMSPLSYIDGLVKKIGNTAFTFPVGDSNEYRPVSISAPSNSTDAFVAQYFKQQQSQGNTLDTGVNYISNCNYWNVDRVTGTSNVSLGFQWFDNTCDVFDIDSIRLMNFNSGTWKNRGQMSDTGNDSVGTLSTNGSIQNFGNFSFGHNLFPVVNFTVVIDSSINPIRVDFFNDSRGFTPLDSFRLVFNDSIGIAADTITFYGNAKAVHYYSSNRVYIPQLTSLKSLNIPSKSIELIFNPVVSGLVSYTLPSVHPTNNPTISTCYDNVEFKIDLTGINTSPNLVDIEIDFSQLTFGTIPVGSPIAICTSGATFSFSSTIQDPFKYNLEVISGTFDGYVLLNVSFNDCGVFTATNIFTVPITLFPSIQNPSLNLISNQSNLIITVDQNNSNKHDCIINNIAKPELSLIANSASTHDDEFFTRGQIIDRYYELEGKEGIIDMFTLKIELENDAELLLLEIEDVVNVTPVSFLLYDGIGLNKTPLPPGSTYNFIFANNSIFPQIGVNPAPGDISNSQVKVNLTDVLPISYSDAPNFLAGIFNEDGSMNRIKIHERLRIINVDECSNTPLPTLVESTKYLVDINCDEDYNNTPCSDELDFFLNLNCRLPNLRMAVGPYIRDGSVNNFTYTPLTDYALGLPCFSTTNDRIDFSIKLNNSSAAPTNNNIVGSTIIKMDKFRVYLNLDLYEYDHIWVGNAQIINSTTVNNFGSNNDYIEIDLNFQGALFLTNPSEINGTQLSNQINSDFPLNLNNSPYLFLNYGESLYLTFSGLRMKSCLGIDYYLKYPDHTPFMITNKIEIDYQNMCTYGSGSFLTTGSGDGISYLNYFSGLATAEAEPLDVGTDAGTSTLTFTFNETSDRTRMLGYAGDLLPWQLSHRGSGTPKNILDCPNLNYTLHLEMPNFDPAIPSSTLYSVSEVDFYDNKTNTKIGNTVTYPTINVLDYNIEVPFTGAKTPDWTAIVKLNIACPDPNTTTLPTIGVDNFPAEFRSTCDPSCLDCYITYAKTEVTLNKHCLGECADNNFVSTANFSIERQNYGWKNEADFHQFPIPNINPLIDDVKKNRVYPCDIVKIKSTKGSSYQEVNGSNTGVATMTNLYFDILIEDDQIPWSAAQPFDNLFSGLSGTASSFKIKTLWPLGSCWSQTPYIIPVDFTKITSHNSFYKPGYHVIRVPIDFVGSPTVCGSMTALDLLKTFDCEIEFEADFIIKDLNLPPGAYELNAMQGQFVFDYIDPNLVSIFNVQSCDPYIENLTYLKVEKVVEQKLTGPFNQFVEISQCQLIYDLKLDLVGGYLGADDFPNEFRPMFKFPKIFSFTHIPEISFASGSFTNNYGTSSIYNGTGSSTTTSVNNISSLNDLVIEKNGKSERRFNMVLNRDCPFTEDLNPNFYFTLDNLNSYWNTNCLHNQPQPGGLPFVFETSYSNVTSLGGDVFLDTELELKFSGTPQVGDYDVPANPMIELDIVYNSARATICPNVWLYFETTNMSPLNMTYDLFWDKDGLNPVYSEQCATLNNTPIFQLNNIVGSAAPTKLYLKVKWSTCNFTGVLKDKFEVKGVYGAYCAESSYPLIIDNVLTESCISFETDNIEIYPPDGNLSAVVTQSPNTVVNCGTNIFTYELESTKGDISDAYIELIVPEFLGLLGYSTSMVRLINASVETTIGGITVIKPLSLFPIPNSPDVEYRWNVFDILSQPQYFGIAEPHFNSESEYEKLKFTFELQVQAPTGVNISPDISIPYSCKAYGSDICNTPLADFNPSGSTGTFKYEGTPASPLSIISSGAFCGSNSITLSADPVFTGYSYQWSNSFTTSSISVNTPGVYTLTVVNGLCSTSTSFPVFDNSPLPVLLSSNPVGFCPGNPVGQITISNLNNPPPPQPQYTYLWDDGTTNSTLVVNATGTYSVTVSNTNASGTCTESGTINIVDLVPANVTFSGNDFCVGAVNSLTVNVTPPAGLHTITYNWNFNNLTSSSIPIVGPGTYIVDINIDGCATTWSHVVNDLTPSAAFTISHPYGFCDGSMVTLEADNNLPNYTYNWSTGSTTYQAFDNPIGLLATYALTVTNQTCSATVSKTINNITPELKINSGLFTEYYCPGSQVFLNGLIDPFYLPSPTPPPSNLPYNYSWSNTNPVVTLSSISVTPTSYPQIYQLTAISLAAPGCTTTATITLASLAPVVSLPNPISVNFGNTTTVLNANISNCLNNNCDWFWYTDPTFTLPPIPNTNNVNPITVSPNNTTAYILMVINYDPNGIQPPCTTKTSTRITVVNPFPGECTLTGSEIELTNDIILNGSVMPSIPIINGTLTLPSNFVWYVEQDLTLTNNLTIASGAEIKFAPNTKITVPNGFLFSIPEGAHLHACSNEMWEGVVVEPQGAVFFNGLSLVPVLIEDALIGLEASGNFCTITNTGNVNYNKNYISVYLHDGNFSNAVFNGTRFTCDNGPLLYNTLSINPYTAIHFKAKDAGQINFNYGGSTYYGNHFSNSYTGIEFLRTNLELKGCELINTDLKLVTGTIGIKFEGVSNLNLTNPHKLMVGQWGSTAIENMFKDYAVSIYSNKRVAAKIEKSIFLGGQTGLKFRRNKSTSNPIFSGSINVKGNKIDLMSYVGIDIADNGNVLLNVILNQINLNGGSGFDELLETKKGIYVHNSTMIGNNNSPLYINSNEIINCRFGIQITEQKQGMVFNNQIDYIVPDAYINFPLNARRRGIEMIYTNDMDVSFNKIVRNLFSNGSQSSTMDENMVSNTGNDILMCGLSSIDSKDNFYYRNETYNFPTHIRIVRNNEGSYFKCNDLVQGYQGFHLNNVFMNDQGFGSEPNGNKWNNWPTNGNSKVSRIFGTKSQSLQGFDWYFDQNDLVLQDPENGVLSANFPPQWIGMQPIVVEACNNSPCPECYTDRLYQIISQIDSIQFNEELRFALENYVYKNLKDSLQLMYGGTVYDASLQNFFSAMALNNVGLLNEVEELLVNNDYAEAYLLNDDLIPTELFEINSVFVNEICATYKEEFDDMSNEDYLNLTALAYEHPQIGGEAVYRARAILGIDVDDTELAYRLAGSNIKLTGQTCSIYPNPSTGLFTINYLIKQDEEINIEVYNNLGQIIAEKIFHSNGESYLLDLSSSNSGIYNLKFIFSDGSIQFEKIIVIKSK